MTRSTVADGQQYVVPISANAERHQGAQPVLLEPNVEVHALGPQVAIVGQARVALLELLHILTPLACEAAQLSMRSAALAAKGRPAQASATRRGALTEWSMLGRIVT